MNRESNTTRKHDPPHHKQTFDSLWKSNNNKLLHSDTGLGDEIHITATPTRSKCWLHEKDAKLCRSMGGSTVKLVSLATFKVLQPEGRQRKRWRLTAENRQIKRIPYCKNDGRQVWQFCTQSGFSLAILYAVSNFKNRHDSWSVHSIFSPIGEAGGSRRGVRHEDKASAERLAKERMKWEGWKWKLD